MIRVLIGVGAIILGAAVATVGVWAYFIKNWPNP